ncbi:Similar to Sin1: Stress-activated map kinase-interacting protein 1 (Drosophila pseudoobscura pseudoobscura) [Cotesia congregata]|uniref:Similar to Sin1: Stress-activated map kinase-interacting protein 1 (Drosophila pseudoobscura pseudoobscura) n=1 Tax=Cotesia congregata TaxID=51543 RepID=A0A8J2HFR1_COTCN|nr:Similar to Sin1: Stress-activated map kinase-interacting protein 1 (Drosophila pseudoobscura pseudoobscura) [Cotesia congregata]
MALYDNKHWLLSYIRDSFISTDDTGMCEAVMPREDIPKQLKANGAQCYLGFEESDDEDLDALSESYDIQMDMSFGHRPRSNTAQKLEKMELERKKAARVKHIKWESRSVRLTKEEIAELFQQKDFRKKNNSNVKRQSLLSEQLVKCPYIPVNRFIEYAKFDGSGLVGVPVRKYRIFMCILPKEERVYPMQVTVICSATVEEFIGLICYKYATENPNHNLIKEINKYGLYIAEDDGEVDGDFPCLDPREKIGKFEFSALGLVEMRLSDRQRHEPTGPVLPVSTGEIREATEKEQEIFAQDLARMKGDKIEIDPLVTSKSAYRFWNRQHRVSYQMENIAWCEITETKGSKSSFTLVYTNPSTSDNIGVSSLSSPSLHQSMSFKTHDFEAESTVAEEIVRKINHILELRSNNARKEFIAHRERKSMRRKSFHLHR